LKVRLSGLTIKPQLPNCVRLESLTNFKEFLLAELTRPTTYIGKWEFANRESA
jgi:hypothetical protein